MSLPFIVESMGECSVLRLRSANGTNRLTHDCVVELTREIYRLATAQKPRPLILTGNEKFFSVGADLPEIVEIRGPAAVEFSRTGQELMYQIEKFPAAVYAAISGYCMGGGLDLVLACHRRIAHPHAVFGHRGTTLGLITGWGGTQRLPRLVGKGRALQMFVAAEKVTASQALQMGLVDAIADNPIVEAMHRIESEVAGRT